MNTRLRMISKMVQPHVYLADIGTDHAWLPIELVKDGIIERACACDVAQGPLSAAEENIHREGLSHQIQTILSDGFDAVPEDVNAAVIAGMGFCTAQDILQRAELRLPKLTQIIVQVNNETEELRRWISFRQWTIVDESICYDRGFFYQAVSFLPVLHQAYSEEDIVLGPVLKAQRSSTYLDFCEKKITQIAAIMQKRNRNDERQKDLQNHLMIFQRELER